MDSYKHSCPFCGQHIEYTAGYCGKQMQCPICGQTVTFPALPPTVEKSKLRVKSLERKPERKWKLPAALGFLLHFQHWNMVAQCAVPFLVIGVLLAGAMFVKKKFMDTPENVTAPAVQADPDAWQRTTDLRRSELAVKDRMKDLETAHANFDMLEQLLRQVRNTDSSEKKVAEDRATLAQKKLDAARRKFDEACDLYRRLGGTNDFRAQLKKY